MAGVRILLAAYFWRDGALARQSPGKPALGIVAEISSTEHAARAAGCDNALAEMRAGQGGPISPANVEAGAARFGDAARSAGLGPGP